MCAGKVCLPVVHQPPPTLEQVRPRVGGLDPVADDVRQRGLDDHPRVVIEAAQSRKLDRKRAERRRCPSSRAGPTGTCP